MGLLSKANLLGQTKSLAFSYLINKYNLKLFSIFENCEGNYFISNSLGFDGTSILNSVSTNDFWNGICKESEKIYTFTASDSANPLLQFFSFKIKDLIESVSVVKINNSIIMICNNSITNTFIDDYKKVSFNELDKNINSLNSLITQKSLLYKLSINFEEAIDTYLATKLKNKDLYSELWNSVSNELINRITYLYNNENASLKISNSVLKTIFICDTHTSKEILINHLILNLKEVLENSAEIINVEFVGNAESFKDIQDFLKAE